MERKSEQRTVCLFTLVCVCVYINDNYIMSALFPQYNYPQKLACTFTYSATSEFSDILSHWHWPVRIS